MKETQFTQRGEINVTSTYAIEKKKILIKRQKIKVYNAEIICYALIMHLKHI